MKLTIATRSSSLALWQTNHIADLLRAQHPQLEIAICEISTLGDQIRDVPLPKIGDKGLFTRELEDKLIESDVDLAVHSLKDLPTQLPEGLCYAGSPRRANVRDAFVSMRWQSFGEVPEDAQIATGSLRRRSLVQGMKPAATFPDLRGNIETRLAKLEKHGWDGIIMAAAALERMDKREYISEYLDPQWFIPAVGQGAIGLEIRSDRDDIRTLLAAINDDETTTAVTAERAFLRHLEGGCSVPIGAWAYIENEQLTITGYASNYDGSKQIRESAQGSVEEAEQTGIKLAQHFVQLGAKELLAK